MGPVGLRNASEDAVLNANYLMNKLRNILPPVFNRNCMHETLLDGSSLPIKILDLAKRMIDFKVHPPTLVGAGCVYFGKELSNAMLFEPTESETKEELDEIVRVIKLIVDEAYVGITLKDLGVTYYKDLDNSDLDFINVVYGLIFRLIQIS